MTRHTIYMTLTRPRALARPAWGESDAVMMREVFMLCLLLGVIQVLDGLLTGIGVSIYGTHAEGNLLLRTLMERWGYVEALIIVKSLAVVVIGILFYLSIQVTWIAKALRSLILLYMGLAICPWTFILMREFL